MEEELLELPSSCSSTHHGVLCGHLSYDDVARHVVCVVLFEERLSELPSITPVPYAAPTIDHVEALLCLAAFLYPSVIQSAGSCRESRVRQSKSTGG
jgi:hypothetical protein